MAQRVGIDTGGTFTDAVIADGKGGWHVHKCPTTQKTPALAVLAALQELVPIGTGTVHLVHGTTHATNALLTGNLGRICFLTTKGHADVLEIGRQNRDQLYAMEPDPPRPKQPKSLIVEVDERLDANGEVVRALTKSEIKRIVGLVAKKKPQAIAICLLHAWREGKHEAKLQSALSSLGVPVVASHHLAPEQREYERATTCWADASLQPVVGPALQVLDCAIKQGWKTGSSLEIMRSDGGTAGAKAAVEHPVHLALSGPAGGLSAARSLADARGDGDILTLDMGGTSTDVALLQSGELELGEFSIAGLPLMVRGLPMHTIGTGGGSIAWLDAAKELQVGPMSAGANPGPICYGKGGKDITVTDAHLLCGRLHQNYFLDGNFKLDPQLAQTEMKRLRREAIDVLEIASAEMERALRKVSLAQGHDPRSLKLYCFGGAGGLHAVWMAEKLGFSEVVVPPNSGAFSAMGLLMSPSRRSLSRSILSVLPTVAKRKAMFAALVNQAQAELRADGVSESKISVRRILELRNKGQSGIFALAEGPHLRARFKEQHFRRFGFKSDAEIELVAVRVQVDGASESAWVNQKIKSYCPEPGESALVSFPETGRHQLCKCNWYKREGLSAGAKISGPAVIAEYSSTTVVPPGWEALVDRFNCISLKKVKLKQPRRWKA